MEFSQSLPRALAAFGLAAALSLNLASAQPAKQTAKEPAKAEAKAKAKAQAEEFVPQSGQAGKDVVWVPTPQALVDRMLDMARVTKDDYVVDLGSGDGRTVITAGKRGVKAKGIEYNPDMVALSKRNAEKEGVNVEFVRGDIFESNFTDATVVTLFLLPSLNVRLRPILLDMKPGTRVVSNSFDMGDWTPDEQIQAGGDCSAWCRANFWIIPAKVEGVWQTPIGEMKLEQKYQMVSGTLKIGEATAPVTGKLVGADIVLTAGRNIFTGKVDGAKMEGSNSDSGKESKWTVTRGAK